MQEKSFHAILRRFDRIQDPVPERFLFIFIAEHFTDVEFIAPEIHIPFAAIEVIVVFEKFAGISFPLQIFKGIHEGVFQYHISVRLKHAVNGWSAFIW